MFASKLQNLQLRLHTSGQSVELTQHQMGYPQKILRDLVICDGGQGKRVGLKLKLILREMRVEGISIVAIDGDAHDWPSLVVPGYEPVEFSEMDSLTLGADKTRDDLRADPFLRHRYDKGGLWRGVPVSETFQRGGRGGLSYPTYAAAYYEIERQRALAALHRWIAPLVVPPAITVGSDLSALIEQKKQGKAKKNVKPHRVVKVGSGVGSWGWIGHVLGAYDVRLVLKDFGVINYEFFGIALGPNIYSGLTPNIKANWHALIDQLRYLSRNGLHRKYGGHGEDVDIDAPPYDPGRLFLIDQARGPHNGQRATEEELDAFQWRVAMAIALLLVSEAGDQLVTYSVNPAADIDSRPARQGEEIFGTLGGAVAGADLTGIQQYLEWKNQIKSLRLLREQI